VIEKYMLLAKQIHPSSSDIEAANALATITAKAREMQDFYRYYAGHIWDVQVYPMVYRSTAKVESPGYDVAAVKAAAEEQGITFPYYFVQVKSMYSSGENRCGSAYRHSIPHPWGCVYAGCGIHTHIHEWGHNLGCQHANKRGKTGNVVEYEDYECVMGNRSHVPGFNAPHMRLLDLAEYPTVATSSQVLLCPLELDEPSKFPIENSAVIVPAEEEVTVSVRKKKGTRYIPALVKEDTVYVHTGMGRSVREARLRPGENYKGYGIEVNFLDYENESARVDILYNRDDETNTLSYPQNFPPHKGKITPSHNGGWYNPDYFGQGFDLQITDTRVLGYWYTFNQKDHDLRWYYFTANIEMASEEMDIYTHAGGSFNDPNSASKILVGKAQLYFTDDDTGYLLFNTTEHGRGSCKIERIPAPRPTSAGVWYDKTKEQSGFSAQMYGDVCVAYWYTYMGGSQAWYMCSGPKDDLIIYQAQGGRWLFYDDVVIEDVGKAEWSQDTFTYELGSLSGTQNLTRLF
jgi:hypothetical protein